MRIALVVTPFSEKNLKLAAQAGATDIVAGFPGHHGMSLESMIQRVASVGLRLSVIEGYIPHNLIVHGKEGRDQQIAGFEELLREMGRLGIPICCYNFMPNDDWARTTVTSPERGGALTTAFDLDSVDDAPVAAGGPISADQLWENLAYFLDRVVPVAEQAGVQLALHPDDPPLSPFRGQERIVIDAQLDLDLLGHRKFHTEAGLTKTGDLGVGARFLGPELVTGTAQHGETLVSEFTA